MSDMDIKRVRVGLSFPCPDATAHDALDSILTRLDALERLYEATAPGVPRDGENWRDMMVRLAKEGHAARNAVSALTPTEEA